MSMSPRWAAATVALSATLAVHAQLPPALPLPKGTNVLVGRVVDMSAETPIGGAIVTLTGHFDDAGKPLPGIPQFSPRQPTETKSIMTASDGYFVFRDLPAGNYTITAGTFGYTRGSSAFQVIEIRDNDKSAPVAVRLWRHAAIGGRVVDDRGEPVVGIQVDAMRTIGSGGSVSLSSVGTGVTDDRGIYRIASLVPADYIVGVLSTTTTLLASTAGALDLSAENRGTYSATMAELRQGGMFRTYGCETCYSSPSDGQRIGDFVFQRLGPTLPIAPGGRPLGFPNAFYPGTPSPNEASVITLRSGEARAGVDIPLRFLPAFSLSGVVTGPDGPIKHQVVQLVPPGIDLSDFDASGRAVAITDARGAFAIFGVTPGQYTLSTVRLQPENELTGQGRPLWATQQVTVADADISGLAIAMQPGVSVSGRVEFRDGSTRPAQRQIVTLQPFRAQFWRTLQAVIQPDGSFRSAGDPPGRYVVNTSAPPGWFWQSTTLNGKQMVDEIIELGSSELTGLVMTFGQKTNAVSGTVTDSNGAPDADAAVIAFPADSTAWREGVFSSRRTRRVNATSKGAYEMTTLAPGEYFISAVSFRSMPALNWSDPRFLDRLIPVATKITLGVEESKNVPLKTVTVGRR